MEDHSKQEQQQEHSANDVAHQQDRTVTVRPAAPDHVVLDLGEDHLGCTDTDNLEPMLPTTDEAQQIVGELLESMLPLSEPDELPAVPTSRSTEERIDHIINLLDHFTRNLEAIEEHALSTGHTEQPLARLCYSSLRGVEMKCERHLDESSFRSFASSSSMEFKDLPQLTQPIGHLATQTTGSLYALYGGTSRKATNTTQHVDLRPPCERTHHTITINSLNGPPVQAQQQHTLGARITHALSDFGAALCLCMQVNRDCMFCLGFFIAFVVSASFLTAFFYRTLSMATPGMRLQQEQETGNLNEPVTVQVNSGFYYIYNNPQNLPYA